jgi:[ribosomal protein S18]-alanine N-acetyltransferase
MLAAMEVRPAKIEDCPALARGLSSIAEEGWIATEPGAPEEEIDQRFRASVEWDGSALFVLEDEGEPVGALGLNPTHVDGVLALGMWILPAWRGRGGGRLLVEAALAARPADVHKIELEVFLDNETAIALYRATGFEEEGLRRDHHRRRDGSLRSTLLMARLFEAPGGPPASDPA